MKSVQGIKKGIADQLTNRAISRKIFLSFPTEVFVDNEEAEFDIKNQICEKYDVRFGSVQICGSSKTGFSFFKNRLFIPGESDLDVSIIDVKLYNKYLEKSHSLTNGFADLSRFPAVKGQRSDKQFFQNLSKGFFNPYLMPICKTRTKWFEFFTTLSNKYYKIFKNINAGIYATEYFFEMKQQECIEEYLKEPLKYDKISNKE